MEKRRCSENRLWQNCNSAGRGHYQLDSKRNSKDSVICNSSHLKISLFQNNQPCFLDQHNSNSSSPLFPALPHTVPAQVPWSCISPASGRPGSCYSLSPSTTGTYLEHGEHPVVQSGIFQKIFRGERTRHVVMNMIVVSPL